MASVETGERKVVHRGGSYARYLPSGHLVFINAGTLFAALGPGSRASRSAAMTCVRNERTTYDRHRCRQPAPATVAVATIALAIAAVAVMSALVWRVAYQPLPWPEPDRLVRIYEGRRGGSAAFGQFGAIITNGSYLAWQQSPSTKAHPSLVHA